jgi:UDP-N-acetylmuramate dehydrogenase
MNIQLAASLKSHNTFGIEATGNLAVFQSAEELPALMEKTTNKPTLILGGGSNLLFTQDPQGWIWKNEIKGIEILDQTQDQVIIRSGAGENWHSFVLHCLRNNWGGLENLSLIPGKVGASPMQNIGAYGVEIKDVFHSLQAIRLSDGELIEFNQAECAFGYRESVFKRKLKDQFVIVSVAFKLSSKDHQVKTGYGDIQKELEKASIVNPTIQDVSQAVIAIRSSKLPDPSELGNAGSFFKNPVVSTSVADNLLEKYPELVQYPAGDSAVKLAAGWLIEKAGWKGFRRNDAGVHARQALVLVNYGEATGKEIWQLSEDILQNVQSKFGVTLEREVNII